MADEVLRSLHLTLTEDINLRQIKIIPQVKILRKVRRVIQKGKIILEILKLRRGFQKVFIR